jgi:hypothetical protein
MSLRFGMAAGRLMRKLRGRSVGEVRVRGTQLARVWLERTGVSHDAGEPSIDRIWRRVTPDAREQSHGDADQLRRSFNDAAVSRLWPGLADRDATVAALHRRWPSAEGRIVDKADAVRAGRFSILGYPDLSFGDPIDWHRDPVAGLSAPRGHWSTIRYLDTRIVGDHKVVWELNRHQHFIVLGQAYWLTGDERFAQTIVDHLVAWMDANPPKMGVNWASSLEVAYRAISWLWALAFLREAPALSGAIFLRALGFLDLHARHVENFLSTYFSPNTHLTGEALGLFAVGCCVPELEGAKRWRAIGAAILEQQLPRHIRADGVYVEQSTHYQRYTIEIYLSALALAKQAGHPLRGIDAPLQRALDFAMFLTAPDGTFPLIGDDDGGQLLPVDGNPLNDFRPALGTGAALFRRADYAAVAGGSSEQALWLLGPKTLADCELLDPKPPKETERAFVDGGVYVARDDWTASSNYLVVDSGPHGFLTGGHAHADALSFVLYVDGAPCLIDPGTCLYAASAAERNDFRSSAAHNALTVDGASSSEPDAAPFRWKTIATATARRWRSGRDFVFIEGVVDGFGRTGPSARHEREILYIKGDYWVLYDRITAKGVHDVALHFHCAPGLNGFLDAPNAVTLSERETEKPILHVHTLAGNGSYALGSDAVSPVYGQKLEATTARFRTRTNERADLFTFLIRGDIVPPVVRQVDDVTYVIARRGVRDTLQILPPDHSTGAPSRWNVVRAEAATERVIARFSIDDTMPAARVDAPEVTVPPLAARTVAGRAD